MMDGSVTIPLKLFDILRGAEEKATKKEETMHRAAKELEVFLSFLITREHIQEYIDEFNRQSSTSRIDIEEGRAKIAFR